MADDLVTEGRSRRSARVAQWAALFVFLFAPVWDGRADEAAFVVSGVSVDQTAASAAQAREAAVVEGQRKGLQHLFDRLVPASQQSRLPRLSNAQIADLVQSFEVEDERVSSVRYIGTLRFRFRPDDIRNLLRDAGIAFSEQTSRPLVVLPIMWREGRALLWEDDNTWRAAWGQTARAEGLVPLIAPLGDLADIGSVTADQATKGEAAAVARIAERYGAGGALIPIAQLDAGGQTILNVSVSRALGGGVEPLFTETIMARPGEGSDQFFIRAAGEIGRLVQERWSSAHVLQYDRASRLTALVPLGSLSEWVRIRKTLGEVAAVRQTDLLRLGRSEALVEIHFIGDERQLQTAMAQRDLMLLNANGEAEWELRLGRGAVVGRGQPAAPAPSPQPIGPGGPPPSAPSPEATPPAPVSTPSGTAPTTTTKP